MKRAVFEFIITLEGYKTAVKNMHWSSQNMSQHKLFDDIASSLADFQDKVAEVEQSISGRMDVNRLRGKRYVLTTPQKLLKDMLKDTKVFYKKISKFGDNYIGMKSDCEAYISDLQRQIYLLDFTLKEGLRRRLKRFVNESMYGV